MIVSCGLGTCQGSNFNITALLNFTGRLWRKCFYYSYFTSDKTGLDIQKLSDIRKITPTSLAPEFVLLTTNATDKSKTEKTDSFPTYNRNIPNIRLRQII